MGVMGLFGLLDLFLCCDCGLLDVVVVQDLESDGAIEKGRGEISRQDVEAVDILQGCKYASQGAEKDTPARNDTEGASRSVNIVCVNLGRAPEDDDGDIAQCHESNDIDGKVRAAQESKAHSVGGDDEKAECGTICILVEEV